MKLKTNTAQAVFSAILAGLLSGCAAPGSPKPPSLRLPLTVKNLQAERWGKSVRLAFTVPERTTDGLLLQGAKPPKSKGPIGNPGTAKTGSLAAEVCRVQAGSCRPLARITVLPNDHATYEDTLPEDLVRGKASLLEYRVRVMNADGRDAGWSNLATAPAGSGVEAIAQLQARAVRGGVELQWAVAKNARTGDHVEIHRVLANTPQHPPAQASADAPPSKAPRPTDLSTEGFPDAGGVFDSSAATQMAYEYTAVRVRAQKIGGQNFTIHGEAATVVYTPGKDTIPPTIPTGLEAVATPATATAKAAIDLSWEPVQDADLASYNVYRAVIAESGGNDEGHDWKKIGNATSAAFHDDSIESGRTYLYRVTSVDSSGNESHPGASARETSRSGVE